MNRTQNILSTGEKVNSAIDNASSYYQARSLTNRANDLVLADMNETSAEYLMLQTHQQLAVNSLSLSYQSVSSILSLF